MKHQNRKLSRKLKKKNHQEQNEKDKTVCIFSKIKTSYLIWKQTIKLLIAQLSNNTNFGKKNRLRIGQGLRVNIYLPIHIEHEKKAETLK